MNKAKIINIALILSTATISPASAQTDSNGLLPTFDYSQSYQFGAAPPQQLDTGTHYDPPTSEIVDVNLNFDASSVLGCAGMDIGDIIRNTFNAGDLGAEFKDYLQTTLAREALTLVYSSPAVSAVLDSMKAMGHARASMLRATCDANEIMANARDRRLRSEAYQACITARNPVECDDPKKLSEYVQQLVASKRWSGTLHDFLCNPETQNCDWLRLIPNFVFDMGTNTSRSTTAQYDPSAMFDRANFAAKERLNERIEAAEGMIKDYGFAEALRRVTDNEPVSPASLTPALATAAPATTTASMTASQEGSTMWQRLIGNACIDQETGRSLASAIDVINGAQAGDMLANLDQVIAETSRCIVDQQIHPHADLRIATLAADKRAGIIQSLSQAAAAQASVNVLNAAIFKLSEALAIHGSATGTDPNTMTEDMRNFTIVQIENFKNMRDAVKQTLEAHTDLASRVAKLNNQLQIPSVE